MALELLLKDMEGSDAMDADVKIDQLKASLSRLDRTMPSQKERIIVEAATSTWLTSIFHLSPLYEGFEHALRLAFSKMANLESHMFECLDQNRATEDARTRYYDYVRSMFGKSGKMRREFYDEMLADAQIKVEQDGVSSGAVAVIFQKEASRSVHREHLIVFYSVELYLKAYRTANPWSPSLSAKRLEELYEHFESEIPILDKFSRYAADQDFFAHCAKQKSLPPRSWR